MSDDLPTDRYFPASVPPREAQDVVARTLSIVAILIVVGLHVVDYFQEVDAVERDRAACIRQERDLQVELAAWRDLASTTGLDDVSAQAERVERIIKRDCDARYPDPGII
jgi:hypothetical protein